MIKKSPPSNGIKLRRMTRGMFGGGLTISGYSRVVKKKNEISFLFCLNTADLMC